MLVDIFKKTIATFMLSFFIVTTITPIPHSQLLKCYSRKFKVSESTPTKSDHTIAYNVDSKYTEKIYLNVRKCLGTTYVNDVVTIVNVLDKSKRGSIGTVGKTEILGLYVNSIIYYDGTELTLQHELAHFFYEKMKDKHRSEAYAQAVEKFYIMLNMMSKKDTNRKRT